MDLETDDDRLANIRACGGVTASANRGDLDGIFDHEFIEVEGNPGVEGRQPVFLCRESDASRLELRKNSHLAVGGVSYRVHRLEPDGTGLVKVVLRK